jgi:hypothetical protein
LIIATWPAGPPGASPRILPGEASPHRASGSVCAPAAPGQKPSGAFVIGRSTAFTYNGKPADVQLLEAETASHIWAERFDKPITDLFDMQDEIVSRLANALGEELAAAEARRAERATNPDSMDLCFQGLAWFNKGITPAILPKLAAFSTSRSPSIPTMLTRSWDRQPQT